MENVLDLFNRLPSIHNINAFSVIIRLSLATLFGGIIGIEREKRNRPAGFRTHMLVCIGSTMAMLTNQYVFEVYGVGDITRIGAQVISGIGFLGAGTIIVTGKYKVKGLTTAAGLWASACMGLAIGIGFYVGAILGCIFIFAVIRVLHHIDEKLMSSSKKITLYIKIEEKCVLNDILKYLNENNLKIIDISPSNSDDKTGMYITIKTKNVRDYKSILKFIANTEYDSSITNINKKS